jgi:hypothetical protein
MVYLKNRKATCHPELPHKCRGLCKQCYQRYYNQVLRPLKQSRAKCHPERASQAQGLCKQCYMSAYSKVYVRRPEVVVLKRESQWRSKGLRFTLKDFNRLFVEQDGKCAVCLTPTGAKILKVDHDHSTGVVRGLLCDYCNRRLLIARNTPEILERAARYLRSAEAKAKAA